MLPRQKPADVTEEEAALRVVRISVGLGELVMHCVLKSH